MFFHDIQKPNCLQFKIKNADGKTVRVDVEWADWQDVKKRGEPYTYLDPQTKQLVPIEAIAYFHKDKAHGAAAAEMLSNPEEHPNVRAELLPLIANHEMAFSYASGVNVGSFQRNVASSPELMENLDKLLLVNYLDLSSSLRPDGNPDITCLVNLMESYRRFQIVQKEAASLNLQQNQITKKMLQQINQLDITEATPERIRATLNPPQPQHIHHAN